MLPLVWGIAIISITAVVLSIYSLIKIKRYAAYTKHFAQELKNINAGRKQMAIIEVVDPKSVFYWNG